ncbi:hypothetical protein [Streptomyces sp. NPDC001508]|uniref:hypothetical protein n=1 Tax=Streptomyces sp. NPDC001508 TaxID=3154656 RepID=UPI0033183CDA
MSAVALAAPTAAPHAQPPRAAEGARPRDGGGLTVKVPLRLVAGAQYPDTALSVYVKIAALALRPEGCRAKVVTLATYLGMSKSAVERGLRPLTQPDPIDGLVEVPTVRKTARGGTGESAHRITRPLTEGELWVRIPVRAAEALTPRLLRLYALLAYTTARRLPVTVAELGEMLFHHTGQRAGEHLGERQVRRLVDELETTRWLTVHRREGEQGRHAYETHRHPLRTVPAPAATTEEPTAVEQLALWNDPAPVTEDGSGSDLGDGSLASKEDPQIDRRDETELGGGIRRRRGDRKWAAHPVDNSARDSSGPAGLGLRPDAGTAGPGTPAGRPAYTGPGLQLSPRIWRVLAPVRHELDGIRPYVLRRIAREIGAQLDAPAGSEDRLTDRITRRYACTEPIQDIGRWLIGAALVRHGCGDPRCETGTIWPTGEDCEICAVNRQVAAARARRDAQLAERGQRGGASQGEPSAEAERPVAERHRAAGRDQARLLGELAARDEALPAAAVSGPRLELVLPPSRPLPPKATYREREHVGDEEIRSAIADLGPAVALHIYGHLRTLPLLTGRTHHDETGSDRRTHAQ